MPKTSTESRLTKSTAPGIYRLSGRPRRYVARLSLGIQRFADCGSCRERYWVRDRGMLDRCPTCRGELTFGRAYRQVQAPGSFSTIADAQTARDSLRGKAKAGVQVGRSRETLQPYAEAWTAGRLGIRESTRSWYEWLLRKYVYPALGDRLLTDLRPEDFSTLYRTLLVRVGPRTVTHAHGVCRKMLKDAVKSGRLSRSPVDAAEAPNKASPEMQAWSLEELRSFLSTVSEDRLYALWLILATTGMRRGEALGLTWEAVDLSSGKVTIRQALVEVAGKSSLGEPKSRRSRRSLTLDPGSLAGLRQWRKQQLEERVQWGEGWQDSGYVFTWEDGRPLSPSWVTKRFISLQGQSGIRRIRLHDLRHTYATLALGAGIPVHLVAHSLGHDPAVCLRTYSHAIPSDQAAASARVAGLILA